MSLSFARRAAAQALPPSGPLRAQIIALAALFAGLGLASVGWAGRAIPLPAQIPATERAKLQPLADAASVTTRVEAPPFLARLDVFEYLLDHPDFATHVTRALRLARYRISRTAEGFFLDDGWGAKGHFTVVYAARGVRVMHAWGHYEQRFLPDIKGEAVATIEYALRPSTEGRTEVATTVAGFVKIDSGLLAMAARLVGPIAQQKADREAQRLARVFARTSRAIEDNPLGVCDLLRQRGDVPQRELDEFCALLSVSRASRP